MLGIDDESRLYKEVCQDSGAKESERCPVDPQHGSVPIAGRLGHGDDVTVNRQHLVRNPHYPACRVNDINRVAGMPLLPLARRRVPRLEDKPPTVDQSVVNRGKRGTKIDVGDEALETVAHHHRQIEVPVPRHRGRGTFDPVDIAATPGDIERCPVRINADQATGVTASACLVQQGSGPASDIEDGWGRHNEGEIEVVSRTPWIEHVVESRSVGV